MNEEEFEHRKNIGSRLHSLRTAARNARDPMTSQLMPLAEIDSNDSFSRCSNPFALAGMFLSMISYKAELSCTASLKVVPTGHNSTDVPNFEHLL